MAKKTTTANVGLTLARIENTKLAAELAEARKELTFLKEEKGKRAAELGIANIELAFQDDEKGKRAVELGIANKELAFQDNEKLKREVELSVANIELAYQNDEKIKRADELIVANKELTFQNKEKEDRAAELILANKELVYQNEEKEKRAQELIVAYQKLVFQNEERDKRAAELGVANIELAYQNDEKEKLEFASQYSRSLLEASLDPLVTIAADGKITDVNEASIKATGVVREKLIGTDFSSYFTEPAKAQEGYLQVFEKGFVSDYPLTIRHKAGTLTDVLYNASLYKDKAGVVLGVFAAARDVTKQKLADVNLKKSLQEISGYKFALEESSIVAITNAAGIINYVNDNFCKISKYSREELLGHDHRMVNSGYHTKEFIKEIWNKILKGEIWRGEIKNKAKDGSFYWVDSTIVPFLDEQGKIYQFVAIRTDITAKKLLSQYVRSLIEASRDPLLVINIHGQITDMNEATVNVTGKTRIELTGSDFKNYFTEPNKASNVYQEIFAKGFVVDYPLTITDHKLTDVLFNGSVYKDDKGNVQGAVIVARDITIQKRNEKELVEAKVFAELATSLAEEAKDKAERAVLVAEEAAKSKQQFLRNMSHEIRTPMNAIIGFTKVLLKTEFTAKQKEYLMAIKMSGDALIVLINDILDLAKVDSGKMTFESIPFRMASSITAMLHLFEPKINEKNLELVRVYDEQIPEVLLGDPVRLHQIILNLVSNAVKFTSKGQITISVKLISEDNEKVLLEFVVADTGIGIARNKLEKIFENFQQASSGTSRLYGGTGLGLAICKQLVESQRGTISVLSTPEEGSSFVFRLAFTKTTANPEFELIEDSIDEEVRNIKVLVVEDMALNQLLMKTLLDDFGFERDIAGNGKIAIEKLQAKTYDIILMDLQMPEMNGFEATDYIRNVMNSKIPIIALTADVTTVDLAKCKAVGMNDYIAKPVDEKLLYNKIVGLVKKPSQVKFDKGQEAEPAEKIKIINLAYLTHRTKSNPKLMMEMITAYLDQTPALIISMNESFRDKDWKLLNASVHKMIPSFSIMGMSVEFERMAKKVQEYANTQLLSEGIPDMVQQLGEICAQACLELEVEFNAIKNTHNDKG
jgi:PAS domain S-box-containing protein